MDPDPYPNIYLTSFFIILALILVLLNAFFVAAEFAIVKVRSTRLRELAAKNVKGANSALHCLDHLDDYLSATQLGITLVSLALGWIGEESFYELFGILMPQLRDSYTATFHTLSFAASFLIITTLHVVLGELVPKSMAIQEPEEITLKVALPLQWFYKLAKPLIVAFTFMANLVLKALGYPGFKEAPWTEEELKLVMQDSREDGVISDSEAQIIHKAFEFADKTARDIMIPIEKVQYLSLNKSFEENKNTVLSRGHTRFPICQDDLNSIIGILNMKDIRFIQQWSNDVFVKNIKPPLYVEPQIRQDKLMKLFSEKKMHIAIVQDFPSRKCLGIVTLEDVLEELVGDIVDEHGN
ncbi:hemolysin family protein [Bdellovibrio reynosensis]|uniref:hemolysin family protein n=1 Tax=Bdellovibrio reynosensis TaxID=2835041 RepID=UPI0038B333F0